MPYTKVHENWDDLPLETTPIDSDALEQIETGIATAQSTAEAATASADAKIAKSLVDAKGDLIVATADDTPARLAVGADTKRLVADSAEAAGVKWVYGMGSVVNVLDYGALADDSTDNTTAFASAVSAVSANGGVIILPPGTYRGAFSITVNKPITIMGYGAKLRPLSGTKAISVATVNGDTAIGQTIAGLLIDGSLAATATTGVQITDSDRVRLRDVRVDDCAVGVEFKVSTTGEWVEGCSLVSCWIDSCTKGIYFNGTGSCSFSETVLVDVGVRGCTTGIETAGGTSAVMNRVFLGGATVWVDEGNVAVKTATSMKGAHWNLGIESFAATAATGVELATGTINADLWDLTIDFVGTFTAKTVILAGQDLHYRTSTSDIRMGGSNTGGRAVRAYQGDTEAYARFEVGGGFSGGGGILLGGGSGAPEVHLYRNGSGVLESGVQLYAVGGLTTKTKAGAPTDSDTTLDQDGTMILDTTNHRLYVRSGGVWKYAALT